MRNLIVLVGLLGTVSACANNLENEITDEKVIQYIITKNNNKYCFSSNKPSSVTMEERYYISLVSDIFGESAIKILEQRDNNLFEEKLDRLRPIYQSKVSIKSKKDCEKLGEYNQILINKYYYSE